MEKECENLKGINKKKQKQNKTKKKANTTKKKEREE